MIAIHSRLRHRPNYSRAWHLLTVWSLSSAPLAAQARQAAPTPLPAPAVRRIVDPHWVALWRTSGSPNDDLFGVPRHLVALADGVVVLDEGTLQLSAFTQKGQRRWTVGRKGHGPGEMWRPVDLALLPTGDIGVLDAGNGRVAIFTDKGVYRGSMLLPGAGLANSVCVTTDGLYHLIGPQDGSFITSYGSKGTLVRSRPFPWAQPPGATSLVRSAQFARGAAAADCVLATSFGFGTARFSGSGPTAASPFIEALPLPVVRSDALPSGGTRSVVTSGDNAALASFRSGDTLFVHFAGTGANHHAILDLYDSAGSYLVSWTLPGMGWGIYRNGWLWAITNAQESPELMAFVPAADTTALFKRWPRRPPPKRTATPIRRDS